MIYDLIVLGGGPAGYHAAERAGHAGMSVLCIEKRNVGGVCLNEGCIPTKTLLYSSKIYDGAAHGEPYGIYAGNLSIDHSKVMSRKTKVVRTLVAGVKAALKASNVTLIEAEGVIAGKNAEGYIVTAGNETYTGLRLLIATGSSPAVPPIPGVREGLESGYVVTNRELLDLTEVPGKLAVIGGGVIGLEMASYYLSAGSDVTVIEMLDHIAGDNDPDLVKILQKKFEKNSMKFYLNAKVAAVGAEGVTFERDGKTETVAADKILLSVGRRANISGIGLESINVFTERGAIITDEHMSTNAPQVYAAGDVNGKSMLAHTAYREAETAVNNMLGRQDAMRYNAIPSVLYTNPELASVGETEYTAKSKGLDVDVVNIPMNFSGRYAAENERGDGIFKLVVDRRLRTVVGAQALGSYSSEFITVCTTLIQLAPALEDIKKIVFPHPTVSEIIREAVFKFN